MKTKALLLIILITTSCINKNKKAYVEVKNRINHQEVTHQIEEKKISETDSIKQSFLDTLNIKESPIKIISYRLLRNQYSDHKDIKLTYKNVSKKRIGAIRFEWYCENSFNKPASGKFFFVKGKAEGESNIILKPGKTGTKIWEDFSTDAQTIISVRANFVAFSDGTDWNLKQ